MAQGLKWNPLRTPYIVTRVPGNDIRQTCALNSSSRMNTIDSQLLDGSTVVRQDSLGSLMLDVDHHDSSFKQSHMPHPVA